ncbi:hypothetical protein [Rhodococcus sp. BS-15]|uniref:hypothetical protein n=1 Tax=Rhodococcus sp. BS-15 TaxID=1304954 RepID=UPI000A6027C8|nr:hypothetical protein [Rhodococcus sp. BS-15]
MTLKRIDYGQQSKDSGSLLEEHGITRDRLGEDERVQTVDYLEGVLRGKDPDANWEFTLGEVTLEGKGWDDAGHFLAHFV